jgi:hypothetical protein
MRYSELSSEEKEIHGDMLKEEQDDMAREKTWEEKELEQAHSELTRLHMDLQETTEHIAMLRWLAIVNPEQGRKAWREIRCAFSPDEPNDAIKNVRRVNSDINAILSEYISAPLRPEKAE